MPNGFSTFENSLTPQALCIPENVIKIDKNKNVMRYKFDSLNFFSVQIIFMDLVEQRYKGILLDTIKY